MISIGRPDGVSRIARSTLSASSMSMNRTSGKPSSDIVSCRWISVMTVASRSFEISFSARRRWSSSACRASAGWSDARMKNSHSRLNGIRGHLVSSPTAAALAVRAGALPPCGTLADHVSHRHQSTLAGTARLVSRRASLSTAPG